MSNDDFIVMIQCINRLHDRMTEMQEELNSLQYKIVDEYERSCERREMEKKIKGNY